MTTLPTNDWMEDNSRTEGDMKGAIEKLRDVIKELLSGGEDRDDLTIASGSITPTMAVVAVDTEGAAASDKIDNALQTNHPEYRFLLLEAYNVARVVTVRDAQGGAGQFLLANSEDFVMDDTDKRLLLMRVGTDWVEVIRFFGGAKADHRTFLGLGTAAVEDTGTGAGEVMKLDGSARIPAVDGSLITDIRHRPKYVCIRDRKSSGTWGQGMTPADTWIKRDLNFIETDEIGGIALSASQITGLPAGTYYIRCQVPGHEIDGFKARFYATDASVVLYGDNARAQDADADVGYCNISGKLTLGAGKTIEIQMAVQVANGTDGGGQVDGVAAGYEFYTKVELWYEDDPT